MTFDDALLRYAEDLGFGELHFKFDAATGLRAIIAIHNTHQGPALGGCRCIQYPTLDAAVRDVLRLAAGMSYKNAMANLPLGGGKAVLMKPDNVLDRTAYFQAFGRFINDLNGRYISAMDSGTTVADMDAIATQTSYVTNLSKHHGNPAPFTALGVQRGIEAAVKFRLGRDSLAGLHIAIQGVGHVGYNLAKNLYAAGVQLTVCDSDAELAQRCADEFNAAVVPPEKIYTVSCDVFAPCALGAILNDVTIPLFNTSIIAGAANNQLAESRHAQALSNRGILYTPDYVINAGGVIYAYTEYVRTSMTEAQTRIAKIYETLLELF